MPDRSNAPGRAEEQTSFRIEHLTEVSSTNDIAARSDREQGEVVWAEIQTRGRGQRGNSWSSEPGKNLTFSVVLKPVDFPAENQFYLSKVISLGITDALHQSAISDVTIKWPNDIYIADRKVAGILIENDLLGAYITKSIAGVGLNVNQENFDPTLPNPTSLSLATGRAFDRSALLERILEGITIWYDKLIAGKFDPIDLAYEQHLFRKSGQHLFKEPDGEPFPASICAVQPSGELILRKTDGQLRGYLFKEIEFVIKKERMSTHSLSTK